MPRCWTDSYTLCPFWVGDITTTREKGVGLFGAFSLMCVMVKKIIITGILSYYVNSSFPDMKYPFGWWHLAGEYALKETPRWKTFPLRNRIAATSSDLPSL